MVARIPDGTVRRFSTGADVRVAALPGVAGVAPADSVARDRASETDELQPLGTAAMASNKKASLM
jgi:hypothetical protein